MRATVMYGAGDVRIENVPDARLIEPTDALVVVTRACICGSDLWPYRTLEHSETGRRMGHEAIGVVEAVGADVRTMKVGDVVVTPFAYSDGTCVFCHEGLHTSCIHGGSSARMTSTEHRPKPFASRRQTEHSSSCRPAKTTR
jgi:threonine dehydrogenase-like Zn-dependent dehydrogenase